MHANTKKLSLLFDVEKKNYLFYSYVLLKFYRILFDKKIQFTIGFSCEFVIVQCKLWFCNIAMLSHGLSAHNRENNNKRPIYIKNDPAIHANWSDSLEKVRWLVELWVGKQKKYLDVSWKMKYHWLFSKYVEAMGIFRVRLHYQISHKVK